MENEIKGFLYELFITENLDQTSYNESSREGVIGNVISDEVKETSQRCLQ